MRKANDVLDFIQHHGHYLVAVSTGATFFGALTYIGNGPNLLVKAIAERADVPTPNFFTFTIKYALPVLLPIFALITFLFFSHLRTRRDLSARFSSYGAFCVQPLV